MLGLNQPMSSPMMMRMFGFLSSAVATAAGPDNDSAASAAHAYRMHLFVSIDLPSTVRPSLLRSDGLDFLQPPHRVLHAPAFRSRCCWRSGCCLPGAETGRSR